MDNLRKKLEEISILAAQESIDCTDEELLNCLEQIEVFSDEAIEILNRHSN